MELFLNFERENIGFWEEIVIFSVLTDNGFIIKFLNSHIFIRHVDKSGSNEFHPIFNENTLVSVRIVHIKQNSFRLFCKISIYSYFFVFNVSGLSMMGFYLFLQENHIVITVEIVIFSSVGKHYFAGFFDFLLSWNIAIFNIMIESLRKLIPINNWLEILIIHEKFLFGSLKEHSEWKIISSPFRERHIGLIVLEDIIGNLGSKPRWQHSFLNRSQNIPLFYVLVNLNFIVVQIIVNVRHLQII
jgi:hypothetical protein